MATKYISLKGKAKWVKVQTLDPWGNWKVTLYPDNESMEIINELKSKGLKNDIKKDDDGYYVTFKRPSSVNIRGKTQGLAPPDVLQPNGDPLRGVMVGNGSDVTLQLQVYEYQRNTPRQGIAARLDSIRVDNLVPFELKRDYDQAQEGQVRTLMATPAPVWNS